MVGLAALVVVVIVLLLWGLGVVHRVLDLVREHVAEARAHRRAVELLLEPEDIREMDAHGPPGEDCAGCSRLIVKRNEGDRMVRRTYASRTTHYHLACWERRGR